MVVGARRERGQTAGKKRAPVCSIRVTGEGTGPPEVFVQSHVILWLRAVRRHCDEWQPGQGHWDVDGQTNRGHEDRMETDRRELERSGLQA